MSYSFGQCEAEVSLIGAGDERFKSSNIRGLPKFLVMGDCKLLDKICHISQDWESYTSSKRCRLDYPPLQLEERRHNEYNDYFNGEIYDYVVVRD
jgi:hypothetical protein